MTIRELYQLFLTILDQYGAPNVNEFEFCQHWNIQQIAELNEDVFALKEEGGKHEKTEQKSEKWRSITKEVPTSGVLNTDANGRLSYSTITSYLPNFTVYDETGAILTNGKTQVAHIESALRDSTAFQIPATQYQLCRFVPRNKINAHERNYFKKASDDNPTYTTYEDYIQFFPEEVANVKVVVLRYPVEVHLGATVVDDINPDISKDAAMRVLFRVLASAGVQIREPNFTQMIEGIK